ncbi:hypothetical protein [Pedobacter sp. L105]|uniref:hypothetical protein n=1 Tax=Pedobacter sp. L105 TaxID=1641871 RepID=UPI00131B1BA4|nr:hypothetical protein [Pedobacter sp. L105]
MNKELNSVIPIENGKYEQKILDKLVKLHTKDGKQLLVHLEVQEKYNKDFSERMYSYFNRLYAKYKLPIIACAIFTEPNEIDRENTFRIDYMGTVMNYQFNTCKIASQHIDDLINHPSPFALILLIAKSVLLKKSCKNNLEFDERLLTHKIEMVKLLLERKLPVHKQNAIMDFLFYYINFEYSETTAKFELKVNILTNKNTKDMYTIADAIYEDAEITGYFKGKKKGKIEGKKEAKEDVIRSLIIKHGFSDQQIMDYTDISISFIKKTRTILKAEKLIH